VWIVTTRGFFSVVSHREDPRMVLVRARLREDLESLTELTGPIEILATPDHDYPFRAVVSRERWSAALVLLASEIDYDNFKNAVAARQGHERADVYRWVWFDLATLQR
jgi:hypothetical protein